MGRRPKPLPAHSAESLIGTQWRAKRNLGVELTVYSVASGACADPDAALTQGVPYGTLTLHYQKF